jgi:hypothetical protein
MARTEEMGLATFSAFATSVNGAALIANGRYEEGIAGLGRASPLGALLEEGPPLGLCAIWPSGSEGSDGPRKDFRWWKRDSLPS